MWTGAELFGLFMFLRIARALAQYVTDSSFVEQGVNQRGRAATESSTSTWADVCRDVWREIDAWDGFDADLSVRKVKTHTHTTPGAVRAGIISADDMAGTGWADAARALVVLEHRAPPSIQAARHSANLAATCMTHWIAQVGSAIQSLPWKVSPKACARTVSILSARRVEDAWLPRAPGRTAQRSSSALTALRVQNP